MSQDTDIDSIIEQLKDDAVPVGPGQIIQRPQEPVEQISDENVGDYVYKKSSELVESTLGAVQALKDTVLSGSDPKEIAALSQLINSATKALDQLNKINIQNKQSKTNIEMKKMEIEANANKPALPPTTNIMIATRDQVMAQLFDKPTTKKLPSTEEVIDGEFETNE